MSREKIVLKSVLILSYIFIGIYILFYSVINKSQSTFTSMNFFLCCSLINNISFIIFLLTEDSDLSFNFSIISVIFLIWILLDYSHLYHFRIAFNYSTEINLFFINVLLFCNYYIFLSKIPMRNISNFLLFPIFVVGLVAILNYLDSSAYLIMLKLWKFIISFYPLSMVLINRRYIKKTSKKLYNTLISISILYVIFFNLILRLFPVINYFYIIEIIMLFLVELSFIIFIVSTDFEIKKLIRNFYLNIVNLIFLALLMFTLFNLNLSLEKSFIISLIFILNILNIRFYFEYKTYFKKTNHTKIYLYYNKLIKNLSDIYEKDSISFLHDDILQDIIISQNLLKNDSESLNNITKSLKIHRNLVRKIRTKINLLEPIKVDNPSLYNIYLQLVNALQDIYATDKHIEFYSDKNIYIPIPYDKLVYRFMHELIINFFKHSKGYFSEIHLSIENSIINLHIENFGDYLDDDYTKLNSIGLKLIKNTLNIYNGKLCIYDNEAKNVNEGSLIFSIELPIMEEVVNENFINRRP